MFTPDTRRALRTWLVDRARSDDRITAAALVGSAAARREDAWSDIDLALRLADGAEPLDVADDWTASLRARAEVADTLDVRSGGALYRVFLLADTLQVDVSFWPGPEFAARGGPLELLFGEANPPVPSVPFDAVHAIRMGWLHALHVRSGLARGRCWQAVHLLGGLRDLVVQLACARHGLPVDQGRGVDRLPGSLLARLAGTLAPRVADEELRAAFAQLVTLLLAETAHVDERLAARLREPLAELVAGGE